MSYQRRIQSPAEKLKWSVWRKMLTTKTCKLLDVSQDSEHVSVKREVGTIFFYKEKSQQNLSSIKTYVYMLIASF